MLYLKKKEKKKYHVVSARARARKNFLVEIFFKKI